MPSEPNFQETEFPHSRVSEETLNRLYDHASPTRVSIYDRAWFIWGLVAVAFLAVSAYIAFLMLR